MEISPFKQVDHEWLRDAVHQFLTAGVERGGDLCASPANVSALLSIGYAAARVGDPSLVAVIGGVPVGFVLWAAAPPGYDLSGPTLLAHGSYTSPLCRHRGVAAALRNEALSIAKARGYARVIGTVHASNERGLQEFRQHFNARVHAFVMEAVL